MLIRLHIFLVTVIIFAFNFMQFHLYTEYAEDC